MNYMKTLVYQFIGLLVLVMLSLQVNATTVSKKVVMIVSSYGQQEEEERPGYEFDEFAKAYSVFKANGIDVDIASPRGGMIVADEFDKTKPFNAQVLADKVIMEKLNNTLKTATLDATTYDGIFIVGGKGAMFDLPKDKALQAVIADVYQRQGSVAAVCHGPAALVDVKLTDGSYLIANKTINGFTNKEEKLFGKKWLKQFEFMLEDKLIERGAKFQSSDIMLSHVAVDDRLVTGQNPASTLGVATALVKKLGKTPIVVRGDREDKTIEVIEQVLAGEPSAITALADSPDEYHIAFAGMYGFYYLKVAQSNRDYENALSLMLVAQDEVNNPILDMKIAKTQQKLGKLKAAKSTLEQLLVTKPDYQPALDMLKNISL